MGAQSRNPRIFAGCRVPHSCKGWPGIEPGPTAPFEHPPQNCHPERSAAKSKSLPWAKPNGTCSSKLMKPSAPFKQGKSGNRAKLDRHV